MLERLLVRGDLTATLSPQLPQVHARQGPEPVLESGPGQHPGRPVGGRRCLSAGHAGQLAAALAAGARRQRAHLGGRDRAGTVAHRRAGHVVRLHHHQHRPLRQGQSRRTRTVAAGTPKHSWRRLSIPIRPSSSVIGGFRIDDYIHLF